MKKLIIMLLAFILVLSLTVPAFAVTTKLEIPKVTVPKVTFQIDLTNSFRNYWVKNPIKWR